MGGCYKKIKAPKAARKFYHNDDDDDGGNDGGNDRPPPHPLVAALRALSPKLARREEENNEKREDGNTNENNNNRDDSSKKRSDGEMAAAIFSMEEAPLSPGIGIKRKARISTIPEIRTAAGVRTPRLRQGSGRRQLPAARRRNNSAQRISR